MRKLLAVLLLLAVGGLITLALVRRANRVEFAAGQPAAATPDAPPARAEPIESELAIQPEAKAQRESAAPHAAEAAVARTEPSAPATVLVVRVIGKADRKPLAGVRAYLRPDKPESSWSAEHVAGAKGDIHQALITGRDGELEFTVPAGVAVVFSASVEDRSAEGIVQRIAALAAGERRELQIELPQGDDAHVRGTVVDAESGAPIASAHVSLIEASDRHSSEAGSTWKKDDLAQAKTGADGSFEFRFPSWKRAHLRVEAEGYGLRLAAPKHDEKAAQEPLLVKLSRAGTLDAHVLDSSGKGMGGVWVLLNAHGYSLDPSEEQDQGILSWDYLFSLPDEKWKCETGADGGARLTGLPAGVGFVVEVRKDGKVLQHDPGELKLAPGETREIEWRIGAGTRLGGLVLDQDNTPVQSQDIWLQPCSIEHPFYFQRYADERIIKRAQTDEQGRFVIEDVPIGKWWIGPAAERNDWDEPNPAAIAARAEVLVTAGEPARELTLHVFRGLYIRGRVVDPTGAPVAKCYVRADSEEAMIWNAVLSGADGTFAFGPIAPGSFKMVADSHESFAGSNPVPSRSGDADVVLRLKPGAKIRGHVIDAASGAGCLAELMFSPEQPSGGTFGFGMSTSTGPDGSFEHEGLDPGGYRVTAKTADGRFAQQGGIDVGAGAESGDVVLALKPGGQLRLTYRGSKQHQIVRVCNAGVPINFGDTLESGKAKELRAPAGALVLELRTEWNGTPKLKQVELKAGETKDVEITDEN